MRRANWLPSNDRLADPDKPNPRVLLIPVALIVGFILAMIAYSLTPKNDYLSAGHFPPGASLIAVYEFALLPLVIVALLAAWYAARYRWLARRERRALRPSAKIELGQSVVAGTVVSHSPPQPVVRVEIDQVLDRIASDDYWRHYREVGRTKRCVDFDIQLPSGDRLPVIADPQAVLIDDLDRTERPDGSANRRIRIAELSHGEPVFAVGELVESDEPEPRAGGDYRSAPKRRLALGRPDGGHLLLSTKPFGERFAARAKSYRRWLLGAVGAMVVAHSTLLIGYHLRTFCGQVRQARITRLQQSTPKDAAPVFTIVAQTIDPPQREITEDTEESTYRKLKKGDLIPVRSVPSWPVFDQLGRHPTISVLAALLPVFTALPLAVLFFLLTGRKHHWYELKKIIEKEPVGAENDSAAPHRA